MTKHEAEEAEDVLRVRGGSQFEEMAAYSRAVRRGQLISVSGTSSLDPSGRGTPVGDTGAQVGRAFEQGLEAAAALGGDISQVVRTRMFLHPEADWKEAARVHGEIFRQVYPANTTLYVGDMIPADCLVEVELDLVIEDVE